MKQSLRHQKIIELVKLKGYASTEELVIELEVSPQTIRRDLNILAEQDLIRRHHGGAAPSSTAENSDYIERKQFSLPKKVRLPAKWRNVFQMAPPYLLILVQHLKPWQMPC